MATMCSNCACHRFKIGDRIAFPVGNETYRFQTVRRIAHYGNSPLLIVDVVINGAVLALAVPVALISSKAHDEDSK